MAREALIAFLVCIMIIFMNTMLINKYSQMSKSITRFLPVFRIKLESAQQFDYLFKCAGLNLITCWDLKEHRIIIIIIKNHKGKILLEFPESPTLKDRTLPQGCNLELCNSFVTTECYTFSISYVITLYISRVSPREFHLIKWNQNKTLNKYFDT